MRTTIARRAPILVLLYPLAMLAVIAAAGGSDIHQPAPPPAAGPQPGAPPLVSLKPGTLALFFIGNRMSEIEPCGCVKNQLGGIQYEGTIYKSEPRDSSIRVDAGAWTSRNPGPEQSMETRYALRAMGTFLDLDAVNVAQPDLNQGADYFKDLGSKHPEALKPLVSSNVFQKASPDKLAFDGFKIVERTADGKKVRVAITGVTSDIPSQLRGRAEFKNAADKDYIVGNASDAVKKFLSDVKDRADLKVALVYGTWEESVAVAQNNPDLDVVVSTSRPNDMAMKFFTHDKTQVVSVHNQLGKELGKIGLVVAAGGKWTLAGEPEWIGVSPKLPGVKELADLVTEYKKNTEELSVERPKNVKSTFASAQYCGSCHIREYKSWSQTKHAHALQSLVEKGSQFDGQCLQCHTLGYKTDNGFYNLKQSIQMSNVQCESCHGPSYEHAQKENLIQNKSINRLSDAEREKFLAEAKTLIPPKMIKAETCIQCHHGTNDPNFKYDERIHKVDHSEAAMVAPGRQPTQFEPGKPKTPQVGNPARTPLPPQPQAQTPVQPKN